MADFDLIVRDGSVVLGDGVEHLDIAISDGVIAEVSAGLTAHGKTEIDATGLHVLPGGIDPHVHFDEPGRTHWEGFESGTRSLAAGGLTTYVDMPLNNQPATVDGASFDLKLEAANASSLADFAFWGGLVPGNVDKLEELAERGVAGFKAFMCHSGMDDFPGVDDLTLYEGMQRIAELGSILLLHAENAAIVGGLARRAMDEGRTGPLDFVTSRPAISELEAISRAIFFSEETGCAIHIVHVSTARGVRLVAEAQDRGVDVTCETCPHFLLFTEDDISELGVALKSAPPVRTSEEQEGLWALIEDGTLPMVTSDHSPGAPETKVGDNFFTIWGGISGCQSTLQLLLAAGHTTRGIDLTTIAAATATNAARRFGLPGKGEIAAGYDADLALVDLSEESRLQASDLLYRHRFSAYVGQPIRGRIVRTLVRGTTVFDQGAVASGPVGRFITPGPRQATVPSRATVGRRA